ncbi:hypothetical protein [Pontibacillus litoralis]|uniref:FAD/FMN-containing dehydrogenase n=1 Tax=Pontibacillus litoralis JSM 072002 TaxID=1385512 RepID=A0A0A5G7K9_9BACI|nr:hypothetical protein [Pontibacillus litoralis]KGX87080.1 hypothetical protein N784_02570 [Pontibacillus litoralis JSM 072002]
MKKKIFSVLLTVLLAVGISNVVLAHGNDDGYMGPMQSDFQKEEMTNWMKNMHPTMNDTQIEQMHRDCHGF